ncbi:VCBS repeat-containing protein [Halalkalibaculum sp. DA3122]|uniref:VCBS repeat-containing protein n=1 Tax=Halalkalibaculum sp. DA3122 TaxID=3373607 RepID=UPI00375438F2
MNIRCGFAGWVAFTALMVGACSLTSDKQTDPLFQELPPDRTGIDFSNDITYDVDFNVITFPYIYNGGGVAVGDINKDGRPDLYLTGNMVSSRLYLNEGNMEFRDITSISGTGTTGWANGASMVDINGDGDLDIYVSMSGPEGSTPEERRNKLFINNGDNTFTERARKFGLADTGYTTHTAFLDYDRDGDLDAFLMNNFPGSFSRDNSVGVRDEINDGTALSTDALYRNNGDGTFTDVSAEAGIRKEGYSLGIAVHDFNRDGWPDLYISNDIQSDDLLYMNNGDGTFTDRAETSLKHTSFAGMGTDAADVNNDGWPDILQVDMMPPSLEGQKKVSGASDYEHVKELYERGYMPQFPMNTLQMSNGRDREGNVIFSEIAKLAGVGYTDWSWSALFGDYDSDGHKDVMITNGYPKKVNDFDYIIDLNRAVMFGDNEAHDTTKFMKINQLDSIKVENYLFRNQGDLTFRDRSEAWGFESPSYSYGAVNADLDGDGDLELVINNINEPALVYENRADTLKKDHHNLRVQLRGDSLNTHGIGAKVRVSAGGRSQYAYMSPYRGYQSSLPPVLHFGLGKAGTVDSLEVTWPDGRYQLKTNLEADAKITLHYREAQSSSPRREVNQSPKYFSEIDPGAINAAYVHRENEYNDFDKEPLLPHMLSRLGPGIAVGDVNGDGSDDFYIGGAAGSPGSLFLQQPDGTFRESTAEQPWGNDQEYEDVDATFFDANGDSHPDLYVVSGGNEFSPASGLLQDRLYINAGDGTFLRSEDALPEMLTSGSTVKPADYDNDGDMDLFVGGRLVPGQYPRPANSYILHNDKGTFTDVTGQVAPELAASGLLTDAEWIDFDGDGDLDLVTTGVWMPVTFFRNTGGSFKNVTESLDMDHPTGWWYSLASGDFDGDGDKDLVAGNLGLNSNYKTYQQEIMEVYAGDFDGNQSYDAILAVRKENGSYPLAGMRALQDQMSRLMRRYQSFSSYADATVSDIIGRKNRDDALHYQAENLASIYIENRGEGTFRQRQLPNEAQFSTVNDIIPGDFNGDGHLDIVIAGNLYETAPQTAPNDAGNGLLLLGDGGGDFTPVSPFQSGFVAPGNVKDLALIRTAGGTALLVGNNNDSLQVFRVRK